MEPTWTYYILVIHGTCTTAPQSTKNSIGSNHFYLATHTSLLIFNSKIFCYIMYLKKKANYFHILKTLLDKYVPKQTNKAEEKFFRRRSWPSVVVLHMSVLSFLALIRFSGLAIVISLVTGGLIFRPSSYVLLYSKI